MDSKYQASKRKILGSCIRNLNMSRRNIHVARKDFEIKFFVHVSYIYIIYLSINVFVAVFLGCTSTGRVGLCFLCFYVQELPKAQPAVVLVLKRLRRRGNGLKSHPTDWEKPKIEPATPALQDIGLSPTPRRLLYINIFL